MSSPYTPPQLEHEALKRAYEELHKKIATLRARLTAMGHDYDRLLLKYLDLQLRHTDKPDGLRAEPDYLQAKPDYLRAKPDYLRAKYTALDENYDLRAKYTALDEGVAELVQQIYDHLTPHDPMGDSCTPIELVQRAGETLRHASATAQEPTAEVQTLRTEYAGLRTEHDRLRTLHGEASATVVGLRADNNALRLQKVTTEKRIDELLDRIQRDEEIWSVQNAKLAAFKAKFNELRSLIQEL